MSKEKDLLKKFIEWAKTCGEEVWYIFDYTDEAIEQFYKIKKYERKNN